MIGKFCKRMLVISALGLGTTSFSGVQAADVELRVMTFNVWGAEDSTVGRQRIINTIEQAGADLIGFQEMGTAALRSIASATGFYYYDQGLGSEAILSRYPIVATAPSRYGALVEIAPGHEVWLFNTHLYHAPYGPYQLNGITYNGGKLYDPTSADDLAQVIRDQVSARGVETSGVLRSADLSGALAGSAPIFLTGDFNEPSHLDWTPAAVEAGVHVAAVSWPTSIAFTEAGFRDSWRELYPDVAAAPGRTWSPVYPATYLNRGDNPRQQAGPIPEPQDRIDIVYFQGDSVTPIHSGRSGPEGGDLTEEWEIANYPSDHNSVTSTFALQGLQDTRLTFRTLERAGTPIPAGYGHRVLSSPKIGVTLSAEGGTEDAPASWRYGTQGSEHLAWLDAGGEGGTPAVFRVTLEPELDSSVVVDRFRLVHLDATKESLTVDWSMWRGDSLLSRGQVVLDNGLSVEVNPGLGVPLDEKVELRIAPLSGDRQQLAFDDLVFQQVPEPSMSVGVGLALLGVCRSFLPRRTWVAV